MKDCPYYDLVRLVKAVVLWIHALRLGVQVASKQEVLFLVLSFLFLCFSNEERRANKPCFLTSLK